jgi:hypothetical protein
MEEVKIVSCTVRELLGMIAHDMGRLDSDLYLRTNPKKKVYLGKKIMSIDAFMLVPVRNYRRIGDPRMGYWEAEVDMGHKYSTHLVVSMTELKIGKSVDQLAPALRPCFSTKTRKTSADQPRPVEDLEAVA